jgi:hypothetical protein
MTQETPTSAEAAIREALPLATPGPWTVCGSREDGVDVEGPNHVTVCIPLRAQDNYFANARYIAACSPAAIAQLLSELDATREALAELVALKDLKDSIADREREKHLADAIGIRRLNVDLANYSRRKPIAWAKARAAIDRERATQATTPNPQET